MSDREQALLMQFEIERMGKESHLPYICIIGIPDEQGCTRASLGLMGSDGDNNREAFRIWIEDYLQKLASMP